MNKQDLIRLGKAQRFAKLAGQALKDFLENADTEYYYGELANVNQERAIQALNDLAEKKK